MAITGMQNYGASANTWRYFRKRKLLLEKCWVKLKENTVIKRKKFKNPFRSIFLNLPHLLSGQNWEEFLPIG
jgi:hypothetical protein